MRFWQVGLVMCLVAACAAAPASAGEAAAGKWKLIVLAFGEDDFLIVDLAKKDGGLTGEVVNAQQFLGNPKFSKAELKDGSLALQFDAGGTPMPFVGPVSGDKYLGTVRFRGTLYPARLEKTDANAVGKSRAQELVSSIFAAKRAAPAQRVEQLGGIIHTNKGLATLYHAYEALFAAAEKAGMKSDDVKKYLDQWNEEAKAHGPLWATQCRVNALNALNGQTTFAPLVLDVALNTEKGLTADASLEAKSEVAKAIAWSAAAAGKAELAKDAQARHEGFESKLDEQYHKEVPPFEPQKFAGRKDEKHDRAVLFELFTGAQCPPCVAADVAFDGLLKTYKTRELVTLQYHLHIPGPDPLTNEAAIARADYYSVSSTPTPLFNGQKKAQGGGGMSGAEGKYQEYRGVIDGLLEEFAPVSIKLDAQKAGDTIVVNALAMSQKDSEKLRLRVAITEESIRYVGSNKLRFHHHVVRAMPGGAEGAAFEKGSSSVQVKVNLADVRKTLNEYLDGFAEKQAFPRPRPPIQFEGLSVVAFVQDDATKEVLQVVAVPVSPSKE